MRRAFILHANGAKLLPDRADRAGALGGQPAAGLEGTGETRLESDDRAGAR